MKLSSVLVLSVSATLAHKGDYQPFRAKTHKPKTLKVEPKGVFRAKTHKPKTLKDLPKSALGNGNSFPNIEEGREPQNSEDGGLVNGTLPSSGGGGGGGDDKLAFDFDEDYLPSDSVHNPLAENEGANFTSIQHTNELNGEENVTGVMSDDDDEVVVEDDDTMATGMNSTIDEGAQFSNDTTTESQEDEDYGIGSNGTESIKEDSLNESAEGGGAGANETSDNVTITTNEVDEDNVTEEVTGINETATEDDVIKVGVEDADGESAVDQGINENPDETTTAAEGGGEDGNTTSTDENGQQSSNYTHADAENATTAIVDPPASENATDYYDDDTGGAFFVPNIDGETCDVGGAPRSGIERLFEMPYFYLVETVSIDGVVEEIEGLLHLMFCVSGVERRLEEITVGEEEAKVVGVNVSPFDNVSNEYVCLAQKEGTRCDVVEGHLTLIIEGDNDVEQEEDIMANFYLQLEDIFEFLASVEDSNVQRLEYVGPDPSSLMTRNELIEDGGVAAEANEVASSSNVFAIITIGATVVTLLSLIAFWRLKNKKVDEDDDTLDGKPIDDKSLAATAALTMTTYGSADESSDISSSVEQPPQDIKQFFNKPFVLAEEEETNWRNLGILPEKQLPLADIREEFSQSSADKSYVDEKSM